MKKILQTVALSATVLLATNASAQLPDNGIYPGGLVLESYNPSGAYGGNHIYNMGSWDIDSILDAGTPVILDLFATWCGPCWSYHQAGTLEDLYDSQGWGGPNNVAIFAIDSDPGTAPALLEGGDQGDWVTNTKYPMVNNDQVAAMMNLAYYPTIIMICPDRTVTEVGQTTEASFTSALQGCSPASSSANDPRIIANNTTSSVVSCGGSSAAVDIVVGVQNYSNAAINAIYTLKAYDSGMTEVASVDVTLNLPAYGAMDVTIGSVSPAVGANVYSAAITTANDDASNDIISGISITSIAASIMNINDNTVSLDMTIDGYGSEIGVVFDAGLPSGTMVNTYNDAANGVTSPIGLMTIGTLGDGDAFSTLTYNVAAPGCHYFLFVDTYGDGITFNNAGGTAVISTTAGGNLVIDGSWGDGVYTVVEFNEAAPGTDGIDENSVASLAVYPNPATDVANVTLNLNDASQVSINIVNTLGQTVYNDNLGTVNGEQNIQINTTDLEEGIYLINVSVNGAVMTKRISVIK